MRTCHRCGHPWESEKKVPGVKEFCEQCSAYLHCCLNCRFHDPSAHNQCAIPTTDWVGDRAGANFCDEFEFRDIRAEKASSDESNATRRKLDSLFGDTSNAETPNPLDAFKNLFND